MAKVKDVTLFRGDEQYVTGSPSEVAKLKAEGWTDEFPVEAPALPVTPPRQAAKKTPEPAPVVETPATPSN